MAKQKGQSPLVTLEQTYTESKIIILTCLASWTLSRLNFSLIWLLFLLAICRTHYRLTMQRIQRAIRDEARRYHAQKILDRGEPVNWINHALDKIWHLYERPISERIVRQVNAGLPRGQRVVLRSLTSVERPLRFTRVRVLQHTGTGNLMLEGQFIVQITRSNDGDGHGHDLPLVERGAQPLIDLTVVHLPNRKRPDRDLEVQIREFISEGVVRVEIDCRNPRPAILQPQIELQGQPKMDCTVKTLSQHHFPFHFAHQVDWRRAVEMQIRESLSRAFRSPLPLAFGMENALVKIMRWLWQVDRYLDAF